MAFHIVTELYNYHQNQWQHFHHPLQQNKTKHPLAITLYFPPNPQPWTTTHLLSVHRDLPVLDVSYKWNHTTCHFLCLGSLKIKFLRFILIVACTSASFLFSGWMMSQCMRFTQFIPSSVACFHFEAVVNSAAVNIYTGPYLSLSFQFFGEVRYVPRTGIAGSHGDFTFRFLGNCHGNVIILHLHQQ